MKRWWPEIGEKPRLFMLRLLAILNPDCWANEIAAADFRDELARNRQLAESGEEYQEQRRAGLQRATRMVFRQLRSTLARSLAAILSAALLAVACDWLLRRNGGSWPKPAAGWLGIASIIIFAWATLGRLQWESWSRRTSPEVADQVVYWLLYWLGTLSGVLAVMASR